jgi:hypothetical protein
MSTVRALLPALGTSFVFTFGASAEKLAFEPREGSSVTKTFTIEADYELQDVSLIVDGQDIVGLLGEISLTLDQITHIEVTDTYAAIAGGRPAELHRSFDVLSSTTNVVVMPAEAEIPEINTSSPLEGETVAFRWDPEKEEYEVSFREGEGDADLLEGLEEDMDLRLFLPQSETAEGESWTVELAALQSLAMPGGNTQMMPEGMEVDAQDMAMFEELFGSLGEDLGDLLEGKCTCTFKGLQEEGGKRLAEISIEIDVATNLDLAEFLDKLVRKAMQEQGMEEMVELSLDTADLDLDFEGTGTLLWNLDAGRMQSFQLNGDATIGVDLAVGVEAEGQSHRVDASLGMVGSMREEVVTKE